MTPKMYRREGEGLAHAQKMTPLRCAWAFLYVYGEFIALVALVAVIVLEVLA